MAFSFLKRKKKKSEGNDSRYLNLIVNDVVKETKDAVSIVFEQPEGGLDYKSGQFVTVILTIDGKKIRRAYSLCTSPYLSELPAITIKRVEDGIMSNYINDHVKAGDVIEIMEPMGSFTPEISESNTNHYVLFGGGSGVTPLMSITKSVLSEEPRGKVTLIYANRDENAVIFRDTLVELQSKYGERFQLVQFLEEVPENWDGYSGYMTKESLTEIITGLGDHLDDNTLFYTCGPEPMMDIVMNTLESLNIPDNRKFKESFVAGTTSPKEIIASENGQSGKGTEVTIILDGEEYKYNVMPGKTILETGLEENIDMPYPAKADYVQLAGGSVYPERSKWMRMMGCQTKKRKKDTCCYV